ncbi:MAG: WD40 repeat domain-containing protein [Marinomonas foliarum]
MKRTVKKTLELGVIAFCSIALLSCSAEAPVRTAKYAVQGLHAAVLSDDGSAALIGSIQHGGSYWVNAINERRFNWNHTPNEYTTLLGVDIDPSGQFAATGGGRSLVLWNTTTGRSDGFWTTPGDIQSLKLTQNGDFALVGLNDQTARFFDIKQGGIRQTLRTGATVRAVDVTADGLLGVTGDDLSKVILWDMQTGEKRFEWPLDNAIASVALSADGKYAFGAAQLGNAKIWSTRTGQELTKIDTGALKYRNVTISQAAFSQDDRSILLGEVTGRVSLVQVSTGTVQKEWDVVQENARLTGSSVLALAHGSDNRYYAIGSNGFLNILE